MTLVDEAERQRVVRDGLHETLFVEAGAGTGKTHELVERVVNLVVTAGVPLSTIAAITFTEAAASELRDRIREAFEKRLAAGPGAEEQAACDAAMADLDQAAIGTLHGFCLRILGEHPLEVQLPPKVEILDEVSSQLAFHARWATFVDELYGDPDTEDLVLRAWALGVEIETTSRNKASFKDVAAIFEDSWDRLHALAARTPGPLVAVDLAPVVDAVRAMAHMRTTGNRTADLLTERVEFVERSVGEVLAEADPLRQLRELGRRASGWKSSRRGGKDNWGDVMAARALVDAVGERAAEALDRLADDVLRHLSIRLAGFTRQAAEARRAEGRLDFHDLLVLARRLLRTSAEARTTLHDRYERLLLDEFQDTDPIQIEVAVRIASAVSGAGGGRERWDEIDVEAGRLFFVGDPKQSIYRFRRADIGLFLEARDRFSAAGSVVLRQNFRTVEPILDWVNHAFGALMPVEVPGSQPAYEPLSADRAGREGTDHRVVLLGGPRAGVASELRDEEAHAVAQTIATVRSDPASWPVFDGATKAWRQPTWADVTVLIPTRTSLRQLEDALDEAGVPYRVATGSLVFDTQEVREALDALRAIDDPGDELALVSALRSPLYACSDVDLFTFRQAGGRWDVRAPGGEAPVGHPVVRAMAHLRSLADLRWWHEPSALLDRLLRERQAFVLAVGSRRPREVWRRLRFLVDQARAYEESASGGGLRGFLDWADLQRTEGTRVHEPLLADTDDDAVTILTIHGAKGLEFPITVLSGATTRASRARTGPQVFWGEGDVPEVRFNKATSTDNFDRLADIEAEMDVFERRRLLYVACTRARDHLVVSTFHKPGAESYGEWLTTASIGVDDALCRRVPEVVVASADDDVAVVAALPMVLPFDDRAEWMVRRAALLEPHRRPRFVSATTLAAEAMVDGREDDREDDRVDEGGDGADDDADADGDAERGSAGAPIAWRRGRAGTAIGRAVHSVLQFVDPADGDEPRLVELATQQAHLEAVPDAVDTIVALARAGLAAPSVQAAHAAARSWRELYVAAPIGDRAVEGYIDLLYERADGGLVLIDYKTDSVRNEAEVDANVGRYALQTAAYAVAIEVSTGLRVVEARLVFCRATGAIERVVPDLEAAKASVRSLVA
jgi:ATP-dependent exoDNAse (exonuclease V) beta subunit